MKSMVFRFALVALVALSSSCKQKSADGDSGLVPVAFSRVGESSDAAPLVAWSADPIDFNKQVPVLTLDYVPDDLDDEKAGDVGRSVLALCVDDLDPELVLGKAQCLSGSKDIQVKHVVQRCGVTGKEVRNTEKLDCGLAPATHYEFSLKVGFTVTDL